VHVQFVLAVITCPALNIPRNGVKVCSDGDNYKSTCGIYCNVSGYPTKASITCKLVLFYQSELSSSSRYSD